MDAEQALGELMELSSQIASAIVVDAEGAVVAAAGDRAATTRLTAATTELLVAARELGADSRDVTRVEVELDEGAIFVVREGRNTVAAATGPSPTSGLVVYDLRTCAQAIDAPALKRRRTRKPKEEEPAE